MIAFPLLAVSFFMKVLAGIFLICSMALILIILIQKGKGGGLSGALGGGMASGVLGTKTGDFLTWVTISLVGVFLILAVILAKFYKPTVSDFGGGAAVQQGQQQQPQGDSGQPRGLGQPLGGSETADINLPGG